MKHASRAVEARTTSGREGPIPITIGRTCRETENATVHQIRIPVSLSVTWLHPDSLDPVIESANMRHWVIVGEFRLLLTIDGERSNDLERFLASIGLRMEGRALREIDRRAHKDWGISTGEGSDGPQHLSARVLTGTKRNPADPVEPPSGRRPRKGTVAADD